MPFCSKCGKEVKEGENFCPSCGHSLKEDVKIPSDKVLEIKIEDAKRRAGLLEKNATRWGIGGGFFLILLGYFGGDFMGIITIGHPVHHPIVLVIIFGIIWVILGVIGGTYAYYLREKLKSGEIG